jgi:hypothetical protein
MISEKPGYLVYKDENEYSGRIPFSTILPGRAAYRGETSTGRWRMKGSTEGLQLTSLPSAVGDGAPPTPEWGQHRHHRTLEAARAPAVGIWATTVRAGASLREHRVGASFGLERERKREGKAHG